MSRGSQRKRLSFEGLEDRSMMAGHLGVLGMLCAPRLPAYVPPPPNLIGNVVPPGGIVDPPHDDPPSVIEPGMFAAFALERLALDLGRVNAALMHILEKLGDPADPLSAAVHAALGRLSAKAQAIADKAAAEIIGGDDGDGEGDNGGGDPAGGLAAAIGVPPGGNAGAVIPPALHDRLIAHALEILGRQLDRIDHRLTRILDRIDEATTALENVQTALTHVKDAAQHLVDQAAAYLATPPEDPPTDPPVDPPVAPGVARQLTSVAVRLRMDGLRLRGALHLIGGPEGDVSQAIKDALAAVGSAAQGVVDRVSPLVSVEPMPIVAAAHPGGNALHIPGVNLPPSESMIVHVLNSIAASVGRLDAQLASVLGGLDPAQIGLPAVQRVLSLILHGAENIVADVAPYLAGGPEE
jgi:hypothetical protein